MFSIKFEGHDKAMRWLDDIGKKQLPFATARALTWTAKAVKEEETAQIPRLFDRPTRFIRNSVYMRPAKKTALEALVYFKDGAQRYMEPHVFGGTRRPRNSERWLRQSGKMPAGQFWTPGGGARLNQSGNISGGQVMQILSRLRSSFESRQNVTARSLKRNKKPREYFAVTRPGHLRPGVWERTGRGGRGIRPVLMFVRSVHYQKRFPFFEIAKKIVDRDLESNFSKSFDSAMRSAR